jgi:starch synthase
MRKRASSSRRKNPRILIVTPEITYLPQGMGNLANHLTAKAGGLADVSASLVAALFDLGADVHVALPNFRRLFHIEINQLISEELRVFKSRLPDSRIHLAEDRAFYYRNQIYGSGHDENPSIACAFQREVINNIVPEVKPDLIHCNDWMCGLIPAMARRMNIPCLFTLHNLHTHRLTLEKMEDRGIDAAEFWQHLFYEWPPHNYEESRARNNVDLLASAIFAAHFVNTVSPTFLHEIIDGRHSFVPDNIRWELAQKRQNGCASGITNAPDPSCNPAIDRALPVRYDHESFVEAKKKLKLTFQKKTGLKQNPSAPLFFWPHRLDPIQKGCTLVTDILFDTIARYDQSGLQVAVVANGPHQVWFHEIARHHNIYNRVAVHDFDEKLSRLGYAASDFMLMPSSFEPCGLPQMVSPIYGSLPVAHDTGGIHDTVQQLDVAANRGNGFLFNVFDANGLRWAIDQAMQFYDLDPSVKNPVITRIMKESAERFTHSATAAKYIELYEQMLKRPLINTF